MNNYYFDENGVFTGSAPANSGTLPPANALRDAPPETPGRWPVLNAAGDGWETLEDNRGKKGWLGGMAVEMTALGPLPDGWSDTPPEPRTDTGDVKEMRREAFRLEADPLRDSALSFQAEAEALRLEGDAEGAAAALRKYRRDLARYLESKRAIRGRFPARETETTGPGGVSEPTPTGRYYLTRSGTYHADACPYTRAAGEWLALPEIRARRPGAKPCAKCIHGKND